MCVLVWTTGHRIVVPVFLGNRKRRFHNNTTIIKSIIIIIIGECISRIQVLVHGCMCANRVVGVGSVCCSTTRRCC